MATEVTRVYTTRLLLLGLLENGSVWKFTCFLDLKNKIIVECNQIIEEQIISAINREFIIHIECCLQHHGVQFEQFVR